MVSTSKDHGQASRQTLRNSAFCTPYLAVVLMVSASMGFGGSVPFAGGTGEPNDPYQIASAEQLVRMGLDSNLLSKHYVLVADIDLDPNLPGNKVFTSAVIAPDTNDLEYGFQGTAFAGVFDGQGHVVRGLAIIGNDYLGLFGQVSNGAHVKNLGVEGVYVSGTYWAVGGLVGHNLGTISASYSTGSVIATYWAVGGLVGFNHGSISNCYSTGSVSGDGGVGGLVGLVGGNSGTVSASYSTVSVSGMGWSVGGLVGGNSGTVSNSYSTGAVSGKGYVGGLVGDNFYGPVMNSFWDTTTSRITTSAGGTGLTTAQMQDRSSFHGWDFFGDSKDGYADYWFMPAGSFPVLIYQTQVTSLVAVPDLSGMSIDQAGARLALAGLVLGPVQSDYHATIPIGLTIGAASRAYAISGSTISLVASAGPYDWSTNPGTGTPTSPYQIQTAGQLASLGEHPELYGRSFALIADIDLAGYTFDRAVIAPDTDDSGSGFQGIGFTGVFDGQGHVVRGLAIIGNDYLGLFGQVSSGAHVKSLGVEYANVSGADWFVGGLGGDNLGSISNCYSEGSVSGTYWYVGGLVGYNRGSISNCYSTGSVSGTGDVVGGLVGCNQGSISNCYSTGSVSGMSWGVGGLVGSNDGTISNSFWDMETSGLSVSDGGVGLTTTEMMDFFMLSLNGFGGDPNWILDPGQDYPRLAWQGTQGQVIQEPRLDWLKGAGSDGDPYRIETADQLILIGRSCILWGKHFRLEADIDLDPNLPGRYVFGRSVIPEFSGVLDGNNHTISNLRIQGVSRLGLFGWLRKEASVQDIGLVDSSVVGTGWRIGGLVGYSLYGAITNCHSTGSVSGTYDVGGLVGDSLCGTITNCYSTSSVSGTYDVGGLVGDSLHGTITYSYSTGSVSSTGGDVGGLVGSNYYGTISNSYSTGSVSGTDRYVGGLVGSNDGTISSSYSTGAVSGTGWYVGGLVGDSWDRISNSFWDKTTSGQATSDGGTGLTTAQMQTIQTFLDVGWDFVNTWCMPLNSYPRLKWEAVPCGVGQ